MRLDCHIHHHDRTASGGRLVSDMRSAGIDGGVVFSEEPAGTTLWARDRAPSASERLAGLMDLTAGHAELHPFFFLDPTEPDAAAQVDEACGRGVEGFKVMCSHFDPGDGRALPVYRRIAEKGKPILFHSGILYDGKNASGNHNRPCAFEPLLGVPRLRFALAHVSWPWTDECIAVFGKFDNCLHGQRDPDAAEMFLDLTPGTPPIYRRGLLERLALVGYENLPEHILWGTDNMSVYDAARARAWQERDDAILGELNLGARWTQNIYCDNLLRFLGRR